MTTTYRITNQDTGDTRVFASASALAIILAGWLGDDDTADRHAAQLVEDFEANEPTFDLEDFLGVTIEPATAR